jgi:SAM-dependent MidA family methyltransferase
MPLPPRPALPVPDLAAREHSERVVAAVAAAIDDAGGFIALADYLQIVLYAPGLGYYAGGAQKFGAAGDFVTAPELTPLFAHALAAQVAAILDATAGRQVLELGAGSGAFAADLLAALAARDALPRRYAILDVSPDLRERQRVAIARIAPECQGRVEWIATLPATIDGAVVMNEVLDAIPAHVVARRGGAWFERGVARGATGGPTLCIAERPLPAGALRERAMERFPPDVDYASELNPAAEALVETIGLRMTAGAMLVIDYGFPQAEYYHPQRDAGTLMGHYRHFAHADPFLWPGLSDLTTHVDFTAIAMAGHRAGLHVAGYASQAGFLLGCGLLDRLREVGDPQSSAYLRAAGAVQKLTSPAEMGELYKVLALSKSDGIAWPGFVHGDRTHRL